MSGIVGSDDEAENQSDDNPLKQEVSPLDAEATADARPSARLAVVDDVSVTTSN